MRFAVLYSFKVLSFLLFLPSCVCFFDLFSFFYDLVPTIKGNPRTGLDRPWGPRRLRLPDFMTVSTWRR
jgi:hypothetical protein